MASVLAIISKSQFDQLTKGQKPAPGVVLGINKYTSNNPRLEAVRQGGAMFLVTVRPNDVLWLVAVLEAPKFAGGVWNAAASTVAIADISALKKSLKFESGTGVQAKPGQLGMSLQTPRTLTAQDETLLRGAAGGGASAATATATAGKPPAASAGAARAGGWERTQRAAVPGLRGVLTREHWGALSPERQARVVHQLGARLGDGFRHVRTDAFGGAGVPAFLHVPTGVLFHAIPGGRFRMGLSELESEGLRSKLSGRPDAGAAEAAIARVAGRPDRDVDVPAFLLAAHPLSDRQLDALLTGRAETAAQGTARGLSARAYRERLAAAAAGSVAARRVDTIESALAEHGMRLPSEAEWEYAARAGGARVFPTGDAIPEAPGGALNPFGLAWLGAHAEVCADRWSASLEGAPADGSPRRGDAPVARVVRGGASARGAWQGKGEWALLLCAARGSQAEFASGVAVRPALSL